jgi:hypothetical protein
MSFNFQNSVFYSEPWPHIVIENFIDSPATVSTLANNTKIANYCNMVNPAGSVKRVELNYAALKDATDFPVEISETLNALNTSSALIDLLHTSFMSVLLREYPTKTEAYFRNIVFNQSAYGAYTKTVNEQPMKGPHLDDGKKIYTGMIYFREDGDTTSTSNLILQKEVNGQLIDAKTIEFRSNVAVFWPNLTSAWHRVGNREQSDTLRRFINFVTNGSDALHNYAHNKDVNGVNIYGFNIVNKLST